MIDVHCHFDMAKSPEKYILKNEREKTLTIGMTNLPRHFQMGFHHVRKYKYIRLALGLHPLLAEEHHKEYSRFKECVDKTSYIGEVGLDFSKHGYLTKDIQIRSFEFVLDNVKDKNKILSIHSRKAEWETLELLLDRKIKNSIFHWYSGPLNVLSSIIDSGYFFSINSAMIKSKKGKRIISKIPKELILTETDFPYINNSSIAFIHKYLSNVWNIPIEEVDKKIDMNFIGIINGLK